MGWGFRAPENVWDFEIADYSRLVDGIIFYIDFIEAGLLAASTLGIMRPSPENIAQSWQTV